MEVKLSEHIAGFGNVLLCPNCGTDNLHQIKVEAYFRREDAAIGPKVVCDSDTAESGDACVQFGNPSARRDGIRVYFECEHCYGAPRLTIVQHKGSTILAMSHMKEVS